MQNNLLKYFKSKNILVAGGSGFIGRNLINRLLSYGANITATSYSDNLVIKDVKCIKADLRNPEDCNDSCKKIDLVFMCAANSSGAKIIEEKPLDHLTPNILMNLNMLEAAYKNNIEKFLFISSNTVYPMTDHAVRESDANYEFFEKYHIVGWMKRFSELACEMYSNKIKKKMTTIIIRPGNLYGPHDKFDWEKSKVIPALIRRVIEKHDPFVVWGDGKDLKDFLYIDDLIDGLLNSIYKINKHIVMNLASGIPITIREMLEKILNIENYNIKVEYDKTKPTMIPKRLINVSYAKKMIKWNPRIDHTEGLRRTINWYKEKKI